MKPYFFCLLAGILAIASCKKGGRESPATLGNSYPAALNSVITPAILAALQSDGAVIHDGLAPPVVNGIYLLHPTYCIFDNSGQGAVGFVFDDYKLAFSNQNNAAATISFDFKDVGGTDAGATATGTFISGSGNNFTVFSKNTATTSGVSNVRLTIVSGMLENGYIQNLQLATYLVSKGADPNDALEPAGTTRIVNDQDGISPVQSTFATPVTIVENTGGAASLTQTIIR
jgi:hypothetical protein